MRAYEELLEVAEKSESVQTLRLAAEYTSTIEAAVHERLERFVESLDWRVDSLLKDIVSSALGVKESFGHRIADSDFGKALFERCRALAYEKIDMMAKQAVADSMTPQWIAGMRRGLANEYRNHLQYKLKQAVQEVANKDADTILTHLRKIQPSPVVPSRKTVEGVMADSSAPVLQSHVGQLMLEQLARELHAAGVGNPAQKAKCYEFEWEAPPEEEEEQLSD